MSPIADRRKTALPPPHVGLFGVLSAYSPQPRGTWAQGSSGAAVGSWSVPPWPLIAVVLGICAFLFLLGIALGRRSRAAAGARALDGELEHERSLLAASEARYASLFEHASLPLFEEDFSAAKRRIDTALTEGESLEHFLRPDGPTLRECAALVKILAVNRETRDYFGILDHAGADLPAFFDEQSWEPFSRELVALASGAARFEGEFQITAAGGRQRSVIIRVSVAPGSETSLDRVFVSFLDVTPLKKTEEALRRTIEENRALLRELYHRTRNSLQVVCSMLHTAAMRISDPPALAALEDTESRIQAMALVHDRLSSTGNLSRVDMRDYVSELASLLQKGLSPDPDRISLVVDAQDLQLALDQAVPCGMVAQELLSNAFRHAFPAGRSGRVVVRLRLEAGEMVELVVEDDGIGMAPDFNFRRAPSVGLQNLFLIGEGQLRATIDVLAAPGRGLRWRLSFPLAR
ncbi:MAG TPA: histidine kinase dimerization/phosphoacceptor domain -containing protein [Rectinemataceae bacterium]|nr:histidine kinase dimerization/phosphoacceptor domain -containing protein [Rectinemataceae bacterium]